MKVSGFTITRNAVKYNYPVVESIRSILPVCDEFIVNVGDSEDGTLKLIQSIRDPKIKIIQNTWQKDQKPDVLSHQTNLALAECKGDWAFYLQSDEVIHENDHRRLVSVMENNLDKDVDAIRFKWLHFFGSYYRYRIDAGWFQKQYRIIKNNGKVTSCTDAWTFRRNDSKDMIFVPTSILLYHYGWVQPGDIMSLRRKNATILWDQELTTHDQKEIYDYGNLNRFPVYFGSHPAVMAEIVATHELSRDDWASIRKSYWWHPFRYLRSRYKTSRRVRHKIQ